VRTEVGDVREVDVKVFFAIGTTMYGTGEFNFDGSSCFVIADVAQQSFDGAPARAACSALRTGGVFSIACSCFSMRRREIVYAINSFCSIGAVDTGAGQGESSVIREWQRRSVQNYNAWEKSNPLILWYSVVFYGFSMDCPRCNSVDYRKDGIVKGRQRYKCKECQYHYTVLARCGEKPPATRQLALEMYLEGLGFRAIGRLLKVSHTAVFGWVKKAGENVELPVPDELVEVVELDEMHTFVSRKKTTVGFGLR
jgi:transposase-like protein